MKSRVFLLAVVLLAGNVSATTPSPSPSFSPSASPSVSPLPKLPSRIPAHCALKKNHKWINVPHGAAAKCIFYSYIDLAVGCDFRLRLLNTAGAGSSIPQAKYYYITLPPLTLDKYGSFMTRNGQIGSNYKPDGIFSYIQSSPINAFDLMYPLTGSYTSQESDFSGDYPLNSLFIKAARQKEATGDYHDFSIRFWIQATYGDGQWNDWIVFPQMLAAPLVPGEYQYLTGEAAGLEIKCD